MEYGAGVPKPPCDSSGLINQDGFKQIGNGFRYELDNYDDLVC